VPVGPYVMYCNDELANDDGKSTPVIVTLVAVLVIGRELGSIELITGVGTNFQATGAEVSELLVTPATFTVNTTSANVVLTAGRSPVMVWASIQVTFESSCTCPLLVV
jgi:hypothetical protein